VFGDDAAVPWWAVTVAVLAVACVFGASTVLAVQRQELSGTVENLVRRRRRGWTGALFVAGLAAAWGASVRAQPRDPLLWTAIALVALGTPASVSTLCRIVAMIAAKRESRSPLLLVAARRIVADTRTATRTGAVVALGLLVWLTAVPAQTAVQTPVYPWLETATAARPDALPGRIEMLANVPFSPRHDGAPVRLSLPVVGLWDASDKPEDRPSTTALVATCRELDSFVGEDLPGCTGKKQRLITVGENRARYGTFVLRDSHRHELAPLGLVSRSVISVPDSALIDSVAIIPPSEVPADAYLAGAVVLVDASADAWEQTRAWVTSSNAAARLETTAEASAVRDTTAGWLLLGFLVAGSIASLGALLAVVDDGPERSGASALRTLGVGTTDLLRIAGFQVALTAGPAVATALIGAGALSGAFQAVAGDTGPGITAYAAAVAIAVMSLSLVTGGIAMSAAMRSRLPTLPSSSPAGTPST
jgi:hypothetical protein